MSDFLGGNNRDLILGPNRRCTGTNRKGERCGLAPIVGGWVCSLHGGKIPRVRQAARERLMALVDPAVDALFRALKAGAPCEACGRADDQAALLAAAKLVLDRTGYGPSATLTIDNHTAELAELTDEQLAERLEAQARELRAHADEGKVH